MRHRNRSLYFGGGGGGGGGGGVYIFMTRLDTDVGSVGRKCVYGL